MPDTKIKLERIRHQDIKLIVHKEKTFNKNNLVWTGAYNGKRKNTALDTERKRGSRDMWKRYDHSYIREKPNRMGLRRPNEMETGNRKATSFAVELDMYIKRERGGRQSMEKLDNTLLEKTRG